MASLERTADRVVVDCEGKDTREINRALHRLLAEGASEITVLNPDGRHNLGVALLNKVKLTFVGSVGYYCAGMVDGPEVHVQGNCGWGVGEDMLAGFVRVDSNAGNGAGAAMRGGKLYIHGNAGARVGISMKGGLIVVRGNAGYMSGFMMQKGAIVICGDTGEALGDSMYEGRIYVAGRIGGLGNDAVEKELAPEDEAFLATVLSEFALDTKLERFRKVEAGRRLWNFSKKEMGIWKEAL